MKNGQRHWQSLPYKLVKTTRNDHPRNGNTLCLQWFGYKHEQSGDSEPNIRRRSKCETEHLIAEKVATSRL